MNSAPVLPEWQTPAIEAITDTASRSDMVAPIRNLVSGSVPV
ncbi:MAG: hypothetical protein U0R65_10785 [Candidatus Nanopelagicales bacterium]|jgi:hypothetical protein